MHITQITRRALVKILSIILLLMLTALSLFWVFSTARQSYQAGELRPHIGRGAFGDSSLSVPPASAIESWMTFEYVNVVYKLPVSYLAGSLGIGDAKYPNERLDRYAQEHGLDGAQFLDQIRRLAAAGAGQ